MRARECRLYWALSIIAPSVNVLGRTRRKPSTIRGAAPDVVIGQSTAAPEGARPYHSGGKRFARLSYLDAHGRPPAHFQREGSAFASVRPDRHLCRKRHLLTIVSWVLVPEKRPTLFCKAYWPGRVAAAAFPPN